MAQRGCEVSEGAVIERECQNHPLRPITFDQKGWGKGAGSLTQRLSKSLKLRVEYFLNIDDLLHTIRLAAAL